MASVTGMTREEEVSFVSGVNADGTLARYSLETYNEKIPVDYGPSSKQIHWGAVNAAGTPGGTLNYFFDPAANWTPTEQAALTFSLDMWSAVANISFQQTASAGAANIDFTRNDKRDASEDHQSTPHPVGTSVITPPIDGKATITMDIGETPRGGHGSLNDFKSGGYGAGTAVHEAGHALGLGHGGPYNGTKTLDQQFGPYDNRISTIMSYFNPQGDVKYGAPSPGPTGRPRTGSTIPRPPGCRSTSTRSSASTAPRPAARSTPRRSSATTQPSAAA